MLVYILNRDGKPLMPCSPRQARLLLKKRAVKVVNKSPFTIQLLHGSSGYKQPIILGVDSGYQFIGISAVSEKKEVYSSEITLRKDIVKLNAERRQYRRSRRNRKTWYRKPRFLNRKKNSGWLKAVEKAGMPYSPYSTLVLRGGSRQWSGVSNEFLNSRVLRQT